MFDTLRLSAAWEANLNLVNRINFSLPWEVALVCLRHSGCHRSVARRESGNPAPPRMQGQEMLKLIA